ncbi:MAG: hypothetical protein IKQ71_04980 [Lachnospiraceae bacterium]|nr:hypothetical protein [Lachnospiraceae bacterium]
MKSFLRIVIIYFIIIFVVSGIFLFNVKKQDFVSRDMSRVNDTIYSVNEDYIKGKDISEIEDTYHVKLIISEGEPVSLVTLNEYYSENALVYDFSPKGKSIGKLIITEDRERFSTMKKNLTDSGILLISAIAFVSLILLMVIHHFYILPVSRLEKCATEIAKGNLDTPLPMQKNVFIEGFFESFDQMREAIKLARENEARAEKANRELITELSHDIKTPVATIKATCEVMDMTLTKKAEALNASAENMTVVSEISDSKKKVALISSKADTIESLITNMFHATMEELEELTVKPVEADSRLIGDYISSLNVDGGLIIENSIPECLILCDKLRTEQAIDNVIGNSKKYADTDIRISFNEEASAIPGISYVKMTIRDFGPGVSEDDLPLITEKYYRGGDTSDKQGYGLGLYLVKLFMEKQGGGMEYYNDNGFVVELLFRKA